MVKRIIFDLDNTVIKWKNEYREAIKKTIEYYKLDIDYILIDNVIESYEKYYNNYSKENMLELINKKFNLNLSIDFIDMWLKEMGNMSEVNNKVIDTLEYLNKKYELVILTNWFRKSQIDRLKKAKIYKYFKEIYDGEKVIKPNKESYLYAMANNTIDECVMIGDNYDTDIKGAIDIGMKAILLDNKNKYNDNINYIRINNINELKEIL